MLKQINDGRQCIEWDRYKITETNRMMAISKLHQQSLPNSILFF